MKKYLFSTMLVACMAMFITCFNPIDVHADVEDVPSVIYGYVGNCCDLEDKYDIDIYEVEDDDVYFYGDFIHKGSTKIYFTDWDDNYGEATVKVSYSPKLRLIADHWKYDGKYYTIKVYNISNKSVTFTNKTAKYVRKGKSRDNSKFKLTKSSVTIKPGCAKTLKYKKISGKVSYMPSINKASMQIPCKFKGKSYTVKNVHGDVDFYRKSGTKWYFIDYRGDYDFF